MWDDEELRKEALMRMMAPEMKTVDYSPDYEQEEIVKGNPLNLTDPGNDPNHPYNRSRRLYEQEFGRFQKGGGMAQDFPSYMEYIDKQYPGRIKHEESPAQVTPPAQKGFLDRATEGLYNSLPGAAEFRAGTDPFLKRKGLGRR